MASRISPINPIFQTEIHLILFNPQEGQVFFTSTGKASTSAITPNSKARITTFFKDEE